MIGPTNRPPAFRRPDSAIRGARVHMIPCFVAVIVCSLFGCSGGGPVSSTPPAGPSTIEAVGDWDDVGAAATYAVEAGEAAIEDVAVGDARAVFSLRGVGGEPGVLEATRGEGDEIVASCSIGRFGDERRQRRVLEAFARRLGQLHGVEYAPIR